METKVYSCIIVDDETLAQELICNHLESFPEVKILGRFHDPLIAQQFLHENNMDIIFLDIEMPNMNGLEFIRQLSSEPKIVLTTAFSEFALDGFELNVIDYLLKPIEFERFEVALSKVIHLLNLEHSSDTSETSLMENNLLIKSSHEVIKLKTKEIIYIEGLHKYIKIVSDTGKYTTLFGLTAILDELPVNLFFRCHRSFIVNLEKVDKISGNNAILGNHSIPISKSNKTELLKKLGKRLR